MFLPHTKGLGEACRVMVEGYRAEREIAGEVAGAVQEAMDYILAAESCGYDGRIDTLYAAVMRLREISGAEPGKGESK
jgi:hypothetical protein